MMQTLRRVRALVAALGRHPRLRSAAALAWTALHGWVASGGSFVNFETPPVHPLDLSPDRGVLAVANLPAARVEFFAVSGDLPVRIASVPVGLDPTAVRFRTSNEVWVVCTLSDSVSLVDLAARRVVATLPTLDSPADVVFAGDPLRAFVSSTTANTLQVFDPVARVETGRVVLAGERPKALAVSPDGRVVYAAIQDSGNGSTILAARLSELNHPHVGGPADFPDGPHGGVNPPPNVGTNLVPALSSNLPAPPRVPLIVKKDATGRWLDDNAGDWTRFISGEQAALSGRIPGWDLPDRDLALVNTGDLSVRYATGLMNLCFALAVNPVTGTIAVAGTDGTNERRFEPRLKGTFHRVLLALVDPVTTAAKRQELNPHLDYSQPVVPQEIRDLSVGDPRGVVWSADGLRGYVSGMGSGNLVEVDATGARVGEPIRLGDFPGPTGLALLEERRRLYVLNRFAATLAVVDTGTRGVATVIPLFDPTPGEVRRGRRHFYDTHRTSGLGHASCASCHPDGRMDGLAWDLGAPNGEMKPLGLINFPVDDRPTADFHPMKGPMVTQTLQDIIGHEPLHWRGDREGLEEFNPTFVDLQSADAMLNAEELGEFKAFLGTITFPPNRFRNFDNTLPDRLDLPGHRALGQDKLPAGSPLPPGNARQGLTRFQQRGACQVCHSLPAGLGTHLRFTNGVFRPLPAGTNGAAHVALVGVERSGGLPFKIPSLRNLPEKLGLDLGGKESRAGFGLMHDGSVDSLPRFLRDSFRFQTDQEQADMTAFLLAFSGSDLPESPAESNDRNRPPGPPSRDVPAAAGWQTTVVSPEPSLRLTEVLNLAASSTSRLDLVVHSATHGVGLGWFFNRTNRLFEPNLAGDPAVSATVLLQAAGSDLPLTWTLVPRGTGLRLGVDQDEDGFADRTERTVGTDPEDAGSNPDQIPLIASGETLSEGQSVLRWNALPGRRYRVRFRERLSDSGWQTQWESEATAFHEAVTNAPLVAEGRFYQVEGLP